MSILMNCLLTLSMIYSYGSVNESTIVAASSGLTEKIIEQTQYYAEQLGFGPNVYIAIGYSRNMPTRVGGHTQYQKRTNGSDIHQVYITIRPDMNRTQQMRILAHEMAHAKQFIDGKLVKCDLQHYRWNQGVCSDIQRISYHNRPWEKEAYKLGNQLYASYRKSQPLASY